MLSLTMLQLSTELSASSLLLIASAQMSLAVSVLLSISAPVIVLLMIFADATESLANSEAQTLSAAKSDAVSVLFCISVPSTVPSVILSPFIAVIPAPFQVIVVKSQVPAAILAQRAQELPKVIVLVVYG